MSYSRFIRLYVLSLALLVLSAVALYHFTGHHLRKALETDLMLSSNTLINQLSKQMELVFAGIHSDLKFLASDKHLENLYSAGQTAHSRETLEELWSAFAVQRQRYDQIRFLDDNGMERVRVNYNNGHPAPVAEDKLQSKRQRYYFTDVIDLPPDTVYVSPMDLNIENRQIELPLKPMIRFGMSIKGSRGETVGVLLLNFLADDLLKDFNLATSSFRGQSLLINNDGYPLVSPDNSQIWSFMFPDSPQSNLRTRHPTIWQALKSEGRGQHLTSEGLFTFQHINPTGEPASIDCPNCLTALLFTPEEQIEGMLKRQLQTILPPFSVGLLMMAITLGLLLWHWDRRRLQKQEIAALNDQIAFERNLFVSGPGTIVKLRNEIGWPVDYISQNIEDLLGYTPEAFLKQGRPYASIIDPAYLPQYVRETQDAEQSHSTSFKRSPYRVIDQRGKRKWVQDVCRAIRDEFGNVSHYYAHISDISALKNAEHKLTLSRDYIQKVVDTLPDPTLVIDVSNYQLQLSNQSARTLYNNGRQITHEMTCYRLSHKRDDPCTGLNEPCPIQEVLLTGAPVSVRHKHYDHNGNLLYIDVRSTPLFDTTGQRIEQIVESHRDVTETVQMEKQLQHMATTDRLTQVFNRLKFDDELKIQIEWAHSTNNTLGLIMFDLDHFKAVNDNFGHDMGDEVLKNTVNLVQQHIRKSDTLARWGGEEFMIITPLTDVFELKSITETLRGKIGQFEHQSVGPVTASFGGSVLKPNDTISTLLKRVDAALYQSKHSGRNCCTIIE